MKNLLLVIFSLFVFNAVQAQKVGEIYHNPEYGYCMVVEIAGEGYALIDLHSGHNANYSRDIKEIFFNTEFKKVEGTVNISVDVDPVIESFESLSDLIQIYLENWDTHIHNDTFIKQMYEALDSMDKLINQLKLLSRDND